MVRRTVGIIGGNGWKLVGGRRFGKVGEKVCEVGMRLKPISLGGLDQRVQPRAGRGACRRVAKEPVAAAMHGHS